MAAELGKITEVKAVADGNTKFAANLHNVKKLLHPLYVQNANVVLYAFYVLPSSNKPYHGT